MVIDSRIDIYDWLYDLFKDVGVPYTYNVYKMVEPQELTDDDTINGFLVIRVGMVNDESEFYNESYAWTRVYVDAFIPPKSRGRMNKTKYVEMEQAITEIIMSHLEEDGNGYSIDESSLLSDDEMYYGNKDNIFHVLTKSFVVYNNSKI